MFMAVMMWCDKQFLVATIKIADIEQSDTWSWIESDISFASKESAFIFKFEGTGRIDFYEFEIS